MTTFDCWTDVTVLTKVNGNFTTYPPLLVLLGLHYTRSDFLVEINSKGVKATLFIQKGKIVGCKDIPDLLKSLQVPPLPGSELSDLLGMAIAKGHRPDQVLKVAEQDVARFLVQIASEKGRIVLLPYVKPKMQLKMSKAIPQMLVSTAQEMFDEAAIQQFFASRLNFKCTPRLPDGIALPQLGIPPRSLRILRQAEGEATVEVLVSGQQASNSHALFVLHLFGLVVLSNTKSVAKANTANNENHKKLKELEQIHNELKDLSPHQLLELQTHRDINDVVIAQQYRKLSSQYHPDRYVSFHEKVQTMAQRIFESFSDAEQALKDEDLRRELKLRLEAESRGEKYVSDAEKQQSALLYEQARFLFRKRKFDEAHNLLTKAFSMDPYSWRIKFMYLKSAVQVNAVQLADAAEQLIALQGPRAHERIEVLFTGAEFLLKSEVAEEQSRAYEIFQMILDVDPEHAPTKRHLRMREYKKSQQSNKKSKNTDQNSEKSKGFFGSFFNRT